MYLEKKDEKSSLKLSKGTIPAWLSRDIFDVLNEIVDAFVPMISVSDLEEDGILMIDDVIILYYIFIIKKHIQNVN